MNFTGFIGPAYRVQNPVADQEALVNMFVERMESKGAKSEMVLNPFPGVVSRYTVDQTGGRAMFSMADQMFSVFGTVFYEHFVDGTSIERGAVATDEFPATISSNGDGGGQLFITSGGNGYCYVIATTTLTQVLTGTAAMGGMIDGYFLALDVATSTVYVSDLLDGMSWDPTQFFQRSAAPDPWLSMIVTRNYIYLLGEQSSEVWYDAGTFPLPFSFAQGSSMSYGTAARFGAGILGGAVTWIAQNADGALQVVQARGFTPQVISTRAIEFELAQNERVDDADVLTCQVLGHLFFVLNLPAANQSWYYDQTEGFWGRLSTHNDLTGADGMWRAQSHCYAFDKHFVSDRASASAYELSPTLTSDFGGNVLRRVRRAPGIASENLWIRYSRFELYCQVGVGTNFGQGTEPTVTMRFSDDGGFTWSPEYQGYLGAMGRYTARVIWNRLGISRDRVYEVVFTDPAQFRVVGAFLTADGEANAA